MVVVFGMGKGGSIQEICEALDPNYQMIAGRFSRENIFIKDGKLPTLKCRNASLR